MNITLVSRLLAYLAAPVILAVVGHALWLLGQWFFRMVFGRRQAALELADVRATLRQLERFRREKAVEESLADRLEETLRARRQLLRPSQPPRWQPRRVLAFDFRQHRKDLALGALLLVTVLAGIAWPRPGYLIVLGIFDYLASEILLRNGRRAQAAFCALVATGLAVAGAVLLSNPLSGPPGPAAIAGYALCGIGFLLSNRAWRQPFVSSAAIAFFLGASLLAWNQTFPDRIGLWSILLGVESLVLGALAIALGYRRTDKGPGGVSGTAAESGIPGEPSFVPRGELTRFLGEPLARSAEGAAVVAGAASLAALISTRVLAVEHAITCGLLFILFGLTAAIERGRWRAHLAGVMGLLSIAAALVVYLPGPPAPVLDLALLIYAVLVLAGSVSLKDKNRSAGEHHIPSQPPELGPRAAAALFAGVLEQSAVVAACVAAGTQAILAVSAVAATLATWDLGLQDAHGTVPWALLGFAALVLLALLRVGRTAPAVLGLLALGITVPILAAARLESSQEATLRWGLGIDFLILSCLAWMRGPFARLAERLGCRMHSSSILPGLAHALIMLCILVPLTGLTFLCVFKSVAGGVQFEGPAGTALASLSGLAIPIALASLVLAGHAYRERSEGYAFAAGILANVCITGGYVLWFTHRYAPFDSIVFHQLALRLVQLGGLTAAAWAILWIALRKRIFGDGGGRWSSHFLPAQIASSLLCNAFLVTVPLVSLIRDPNEPLLPDMAPIGDTWGWLGWLVVFGAVAWHTAKTDFRILPLFCGLGLGAGLLAACSHLLAGRTGWPAFHAVVLLWVVTAWGGLALRRLSGQTASARSVSWLWVTGGLLTAFVLRGVLAGDPSAARPAEPRVVALPSLTNLFGAGLFGTYGLFVLAALALLAVALGAYIQRRGFALSTLLDSIRGHRGYTPPL